MDVLKALEVCGGAARRPALARLGVDDAALRRAMRAGVLQPDRGLYALPTAPPDLVAVLRNRELLTCSSAAAAYDLWSLPSDGRRHVHHRRQEAVLSGSVHHAGLLLPPSRFQPVAALADVLIHALRCLSFAESLVMVESAVSRGEMTVDFLRQRLPGKRNGRARAVLDWVDTGADSLLETLARTYFRQAGISVEAQVYLERVGYVDLLLDGWLVVELDGRHHAEWKQVQKDHRRNNESAIQGYTALRYYYADVVHRPHEMVQQVLAVLRRRR
ncbi:endonuclease domain-containing protein [Pseudarthrobacter sp. LMD1-1-1.1]|uniref:endonuclease domain-containing protein n=1 Tax=Pseudarthrobacter sp. LMD1-1-1.1 TaxID=3135242 RepID=UPI0034174B71